MTARLLDSKICARVTKLAKETKKECFVAVAYFGQGASELLPLPKNSVLVVNMSEAAVRGCNTCPAEVEKMLRPGRGIKVYSCPGLHAKMFVFDDRAIVGSNNATMPSKFTLIEAAIETTESKVISECIDFVKAHCLTKITKKETAELGPLWIPTGGTGGGLSSGKRFLWAVGLCRRKWDEKDTQEAKKARPLAEKLLGDPTKFRLEDFCWEGRENISDGDLLMQVMKEANNRVMLHAPGTVLRAQKYHVGRSDRMIVFLKVPKKNRVRRTKLQNHLDSPSKKLKRLKHVCQLTNPKLVAQIFSFWNTPPELRE
jgi:hypothetical protein